MPLANPADCWDEVWDDFEARHRPAEPPPPAPAPAPRRRPRLRRGPVAFLALMLLGVGLLAFGPGRPLVHLAGMLLRQDAGRVLAQLDGAGLQPALARPAAMPDLGGEAGVYLALLAGEVQAGWQDPVALRQMIVARRLAPETLANATLRPLEMLGQWRLQGLSEVRLELAPRAGPGALGLDLAWRDGAWRVTRLAWPG
ncbi:hypothetical protein NON00_23470 [Roseomonas sp. GC11]|uniref:hypothetical protein n=1 Tax=Roseomonas sp. GC11 TaxID=2950546 RepID=UPI00210D11BF|nr:hypothetical protein [Roseomonas sp. GC11]MCQ4162866.1 hypothetical protein [Roseomonas sp. GC11]